jgi:hypothetical protein
MENLTKEQAIRVTNVYVGVNKLGKTKHQVAKEFGISLIAVGRILKKQLHKDLTDHIDSFIFNM